MKQPALNQLKSSTALFTALSITLGLATAISIQSLQPAMAKTPSSITLKQDSAYEYVLKVFEKLQSHWEPQAYDRRLTNSLLTFTLNENGTLSASNLQASTADNGAGEQALEFVRKAAPFGRFPEALQGSQLQFKFKLASSSLQMLSYQVLPASKKDAVIKYNAPIDGAQLGASLFFASAAVGTPGKVVWKDPDAVTSDEQSMASYVSSVQEAIQQRWRLPEGVSSSQRAIALLMIDRDGSLLSATLKQTSGNKMVDKAALNAVMQSAPFARVPASAQSLPVEIEYVFEPVAPEPSENN